MPPINPTTVNNAARRINWGKIATKIGGGLAAGLVAYNAHQTAKRVSAENVKISAANRTTAYYMDSRRMEDRGAVTNGLKDWYFRTNVDWNLPDKFNAVTGYIKGGFQQIASDIVPAVLATGALLGKGASKFFGIGLLLYGIKYLLCDVIDIGKINHLK